MIDDKLIDEMLQAFDEIQQPRTPYVLENMVVGAKHTVEQRYAQCVLELSIAYDNLRIAKAQARIKEIEIEEAPCDTEKQRCEVEIKQVELEQLNRARIGALREFEYLFGKWQTFPKQFTRQEINAAQPEEYMRRLQLQANQDIMATGRISQGNQEGLRQIGMHITPSLDYVRDVERRYLEAGKARMLIAVATEVQATGGLPVLDGLLIPSGVEHKVLNVHGRPVDDAYNYAAMQAAQEDADWLVTVEDDTYPPPDALVKLLQIARNYHGKAAVGAWYPKRQAAREGVHIVIRDGQRTFLPDDGQVHEVHTLAMGCTIYPTKMFYEIPQPWFQTTANLTQDSFFSQLAREHGYKLLCDTSIKCKHIDRNTGEVYE